MYTLRISSLALALVCLLGTACKKEGKDNTDVTFTNQLDEQVTLDIYASMEDYASNSNVMLRKTLAPNENTILPGNTFKNGMTYYMDWYSDNYFYNNWFNDKYPTNTSSQVAIKPTAGNNTYYINAQSAGNARVAFLPNESSSSEWTAIDVYGYSQSTGYVSYWQNLSPKERYREVTVKKGFTATYNHQDSTGKILTDEMDFVVHYSEQPYIEFVDMNGAALGSMTAGKLPGAGGTEHESAAQDSVMALFPDSDYSFLMVRNK